VWEADIFATSKRKRCANREAAREDFPRVKDVLVQEAMAQADTRPTVW
jgi:hypothetical protein